MSSSVPTPLNDFSNCHSGILSKLEVMDQLADWSEAANRARTGAKEVLEFFREVMFEHHREEEQDLFPAVEAAATPGHERTHLVDMARALTQEHRELETLWRQLEPGLKRLAKGQDMDLPADLLAGMVKAYSAHARREEADYLPMAHAVLSREGGRMDALALALHIRHRPAVVGYI